MTSTIDTDRDWFEEIALVARRFKEGPSATCEPVRLDRPPDWIDLGAVIDLPSAIARWELAIEGRSLLPLIALWKAKVLTLGEQETPGGIGDDLAATFWTLTGLRAVEAVMLEIDWIGGDPDSRKNAPDATLDDLMLYCKEAPREQLEPWKEWMDKHEKQNAANAAD